MGDKICYSFSLQDSSKPLQSRFLLSDQLYCTADVPPTEKVMLWLGVKYFLFSEASERSGIISILQTLILLLFFSYHYCFFFFFFFFFIIKLHLMVSQGFAGTREHWQSIEGRKGT